MIPGYFAKINFQDNSLIPYVHFSSTESEASDEDELSVASTASDDGDSSPSLSLVSFFPPMTKTYGNYLHEPSRTDNAIYKR